MKMEWEEIISVRFGRLGVAACLIIGHHRRFIPLESLEPFFLFFI
jgi:hypothetical protein